MTVFDIIALILREQNFFKRRTFLLTHPVVFGSCLSYSDKNFTKHVYILASDLLLKSIILFSKVIAENATGLLFKNKRDRKILNVDPKVKSC